jgi:hypothetical protein
VIQPPNLITSWLVSNIQHLSTSYLTPTALFAQPATHIPPPPSTPPTTIPPIVYRIHRLNAQTRYSFATGFSAKNQTTILNYTSALSRFGLAHLYQQTNISSPFISVYDNLQHAEDVAKHWAEKWGEEVLVVSVDTRHFARGPVFRAADLLKVCSSYIRWIVVGDGALTGGRMRLLQRLMSGCIGASIWSCTVSPLRLFVIRRLSVGAKRRPGGLLGLLVVLENV